MPAAAVLESSVPDQSPKRWGMPLAADEKTRRHKGARVESALALSLSLTEPKVQRPSDLVISEHDRLQHFLGGLPLLTE